MLSLFSALCQSERVLLAVGDCVQFQQEVRSALEELIQGQQELQAEAAKILDAETVREAQQMLLMHQVTACDRTICAVSRSVSFVAFHARNAKGKCPYVQPKCRASDLIQSNTG